MSPLLVLALAVTTATPVLTLDEALAEAQRKNPDLKAARARLAQAEQSSRKAWSGYLPTIVASGAYTRNSDEASISLPTVSVIRDVGAPTSAPGDTEGTPTNLALIPTEFEEAVIQPLNALNAQLEVRQALIVPTLWAGIQAAAQAEELARLSTEAQRREVLFIVAQAYYGAAAQQESLRAQARLLELNQAREKDTQARFDAGTVTRVALLRAKLDRTRAEQDLLRSRNALASAKLALATLLGRGPDFELAPPPEPLQPRQEGEEMLQHALTERPDVAAARKGEELAETNRRGAWYAYLPTVGLSGAYRWSNVGGFTGEATTWLVTLSASWTIWDGGLREATLKEQSAKVAEAEAQREGAEARAREEVLRNQLELESALANRSKASEALELARESQRLTDISFKEGMATYLEVADANAALTAAEVGDVAERLQASLAALRLLKAVGSFSPTEPPAQLAPNSQSAPAQPTQPPAP
ncbi:TolC family protein [Hyalangium rubrum]|uniref:TolC family protein n=1 Tax=Hyalangium rubrum TaxID=3103134 RepID=A0ABU5H282_9BACT|nr:TolC family protein [Hyalangium sp. s54d21]MDY7227490.1 TolC family protein [Hyalangium sp. s54d21]